MVETALVSDATRRVLAVFRSLGGVAGMNQLAFRPVLCFATAAWEPRRVAALIVDGVHIQRPDTLRALFQTPGALNATQVEETARRFSARLAHAALDTADASTPEHLWGTDPRYRPQRRSG